MDTCGACRRPHADHTKWRFFCPPGFGVSLASRFKPTGVPWVSTRNLPHEDA